MSYVALHCHIRPGLDDGAATMEETLRHARRLHAEGVRDVSCTPHIKRAHYPDLTLSELAARREEAQRAISAEGLGVGAARRGSPAACIRAASSRMTTRCSSRASSSATSPRARPARAGC